MAFIIQALKQSWFVSTWHWIIKDPSFTTIIAFGNSVLLVLLCKYVLPDTMTSLLSTLHQQRLDFESRKYSKYICRQKYNYTRSSHNAILELGKCSINFALSEYSLNSSMRSPATWGYLVKSPIFSFLPGYSLSNFNPSDKFELKTVLTTLCEVLSPKARHSSNIFFLSLFAPPLFLEWLFAVFFHYIPFR